MEILNWRDVIGKPSVIGEFDLYIAEWQMTIFNFKAIRTKKGSVFGAPPAYSKDHDGAKKFYPYISFSKERQEKFNAAVNALLTPYVQAPHE